MATSTDPSTCKFTKYKTTGHSGGATGYFDRPRVSCCSQLKFFVSHRNYYIHTGKFICKKKKREELVSEKYFFRGLCGNGYVRDALTQVCACVCVRGWETRTCQLASRFWSRVWLWKGTEKTESVNWNKNAKCFLSFYVSLMKLRSPFFKKNPWDENEIDLKIKKMMDASSNWTKTTTTTREKKNDERLDVGQGFLRFFKKKNGGGLNF